MPHPPQIGDEIEKLYIVFGRYAGDAHMDSCPCCRGQEATRPLYARPLRQLTPGDLHFYAFCAMTTMGGVDDFKHFLPRIFELLFEDEFIVQVDTEVVLSKLRYGKWDTWPADEQVAVRHYLNAVWQLQLNDPPPIDDYRNTPVARWLCSIARAEEDLGLYLHEWGTNSTPAAQANLSRFISSHRDELCSGQVPAGYWEGAVDQWRQLAGWIRSRETSDPPTRQTEQHGPQ